MRLCLKKMETASREDEQSPADVVIIHEVPPDPDILQRIGALRWAVWQSEGCLDEASFPAGVWCDADDVRGRHFVAVSVSGEVVAAARLLTHSSAETSDRDVAVWKHAGLPLTFPAADLGRLVVRAEHRRRGLGTRLNAARIDAARAGGARSVITTASPANARLLRGAGFRDVGVTVTFADRPGATFAAMQLDL